MPKKTLLIGLPILVLTLLIAVTVVLPRLAHVAPIETKAIGVWQETDSRQAYKLTVSRDPDATGRVWYTVTYPRSFLVPFPASLDGDQILIWGENAISDIVCSHSPPLTAPSRVIPEQVARLSSAAILR